MATQGTAAAAVLSPRQREIVDLLTMGLTQSQVAERLGISPQTLKNHLTEARARMGVPNTTALILALMPTMQVERAEWLDVQRRLTFLENLHRTHGHE